MNASTSHFEADDGKRVYLHTWLPDEGIRPKAVVHIAHGLAEHSARYARVAEALTDAGFAVYANDHRGHGHTAGGDDDLGWFAERGGWDRTVGDLHALLKRARAEHPDLPLVLFGHSMGSTLALAVLQTWPDIVDAAVLSGPTGQVGPLLIAGRAIARTVAWSRGPRHRSMLLNNMAFGAYNKAFAPNRTEFDWLSRDPAEVDKYVADPWCGFPPSTQLWRDLLAGQAAIQAPANIARMRQDLPIRIFWGDRDPVGGNGSQVNAIIADMEAAGLTGLTHQVYADARHECLNETNRDQVTADLIAWIEGAVSPVA